jgi:predicted DNA-binding transcriptional regulator YafY
MAEDKPRLIRLIAILTQLQSMRIVTARTVADKHKVSIRTVYRDIRTLEQSGIPIFTEEGIGYSRAIVFQLNQEIPVLELKACIKATLMYHKVKHHITLGI